MIKRLEEEIYKCRVDNNGETRRSRQRRPNLLVDRQAFNNNEIVFRNDNSAFAANSRPVLYVDSGQFEPMLMKRVRLPDERQVGAEGTGDSTGDVGESSQSIIVIDNSKFYPVMMKYEIKTRAAPNVTNVVNIGMRPPTAAAPEKIQLRNEPKQESRFRRFLHQRRSLNLSILGNRKSKQKQMPTSKSCRDDMSLDELRQAAIVADDRTLVSNPETSTAAVDKLRQYFDLVVVDRERERPAVDRNNKLKLLQILRRRRRNGICSYKAGHCVNSSCASDRWQDHIKPDNGCGCGGQKTGGAIMGQCLSDNNGRLVAAEQRQKSKSLTDLTTAAHHYYSDQLQSNDCGALNWSANDLSDLKVILEAFTGAADNNHQHQHRVAIMKESRRTAGGRGGENQLLTPTVSCRPPPHVQAAAPAAAAPPPVIKSRRRSSMLRRKRHSVGTTDVVNTWVYRRRCISLFWFFFHSVASSPLHILLLWF